MLRSAPRNPFGPLAALLALIAALLSHPAQAQSPTPQQCLHPATEAMAAHCNALYRLCIRPPNDEWKQKWRSLCAVPAAGASTTPNPVAAAAFSGTATVTSSAPRSAFKSVAQVSWLPKAGSRTEFVPRGTLTITGTSGDCTGSETVDLGPDDGELEIKRGADGKPSHYRGMGMKPLTLRVVCPKARGAGVIQVSWFNTAEDFRVVRSGRLQGEMSDPDGHWKWEWSFAP